MTYFSLVFTGNPANIVFVLTITDKNISSSAIKGLTRLTRKAWELIMISALSPTVVACPRSLVKCFRLWWCVFNFLLSCRNTGLISLTLIASIKACLSWMLTPASTCNVGKVENEAFQSWCYSWIKQSRLFPNRYATIICSDFMEPPFWPWLRNM